MNVQARDRVGGGMPSFLEVFMLTSSISCICLPEIIWAACEKDLDSSEKLVGNMKIFAYFFIKILFPEAYYV